MGVPVRMQYSVAKYLIKQKLTKREKYPLVLMLEPLFKCNLECAGCGKIQYPEETLRQRLSPESCWGAAEECGAPVVSIAGGEPLIHPEIDHIVDGLIQRGKFIYLCTNAILLEKNLHKFKPSSQLIFSVHLDGVKETHDRMVCRQGVFDKATSAIRAAKARGFRVMTNTTIFNGEDPQEFRRFFDYCTNELKVDGMMISPGYAYEQAPEQTIFLKREETKKLFRAMLADRQKHAWPFNHTPFYLDFLMGEKEYDCTAWGNPLRNVFGWQRPCYLMSDGGYAKSYKELLEETDWSLYGRNSSNPKCAHCMVHCGYEPTAVVDTFNHPIEALRSSLGWKKPPSDGGSSRRSVPPFETKPVLQAE